MDIQECLQAVQRLSDRLDSHIADMQYQIRQLEPASLKEVTQTLDKFDKRITEVDSRGLKVDAKMDAIIGSNMLDMNITHTVKEMQDMFVKSSLGLKEIEPYMNASASWISRLINEEQGDCQTRHKLYLFLKEKIIYKERANVLTK